MKIKLDKKLGLKLKKLMKNIMKRLLFSWINKKMQFFKQFIDWLINGLKLAR